MGLVRIPGESKAAPNEPLRRCIEFASERSGVDQFRLAETMSYFLEAVADEVTKGRIVQIPGFGAFAPIQDRYFRGKDLVRRCRVRFHPSVGFQQQVKLGAPPQKSVARKFLTYRTNHSAGDNVAGNSSRVFLSMQYFRKLIASQLGHARD